MVSAALFLKARPFPPLSEGAGATGDAVRDEQENLVVDGHSLRLFEVLHGAFA